MEQELYKLPEGWRWKPLSAVADMSRKSILPENGEEYNYIGLEHIEGGTGHLVDYEPTKGSEISSTKTAFAQNMVLYGKLRPYLNKVHVAKFDGIATTEIIPFECHDELDAEYLARYMRSGHFLDAVMANCSGARMPRATTKFFKVIAQIPLPSLNEQKRIVAKLDALFTRIDAALSYLQGTIELSKALFSSALVKSFEENPDWRHTEVKEIFNVVNGRAYKKQELLDSGKYQVVRIQNLKGGEAYYYSDLELKSDKYCNAGDLLFSWSGTPGTSFGAFIWQGERSIYHYHIWKMEPLVELHPRFAYWLLRDLTEEAISSSRGVAGMLHITKGMMESFSVQLPPIEDQVLVATYLDELEECTHALEAETQERLDQLTAFKSSLLDAAFRGQLYIGDIEGAVGAG